MGGKIKARVYKSTGSWYILKDSAGRQYNGRIKGVLKIDDITSTNPIAVGDWVEVEMENEGESTVTITQIYDRKNYIARVSPHRKVQHHIIASNLDQALLFVTLREPRTSLGFIDRFLITAEAYHIPAIIVFNKADLYREKELEKYAEWEEMFTQIGYTVALVSVKNGQGIDDLKKILKDKTTLISGHSGVGKSTFINAVFPEMALRTQEVSGWSGKGLHTTTFAEMFDLPGGGSIIDTPGIRELGLVGISKQELSHYYPEMRKLLSDCQFNNCLHMNEPGCAVKEAVNEGKIHIDRYVSYCTILDSIDERKF
ncbi:ribosome small subunit-dependent GTPase A [Flavihumibacter profundi]|jgi:ribosome biogenesis GTPase / thiamine phosphate phosphatase|uniref:ribosome small subunit-dependent GTPase A n=1 Tax=Flavihumibacter profundi TaxID=2716883 RepID=UPI001CC57CC1|nr:ribosome small subunit-dependent GTPase A [Flavihumibacter profundi]MBZ5858507.1 ribosome small subunit-dependent GTPase A [Flavihumibacter profundi]